MKIEILGTGCTKCEKLKEYALKAVEKAGVDAEVLKVEDMDKIMDMGVMMTPALAINGEVKAVGKLLTVDQIVEYIKEA